MKPILLSILVSLAAFTTLSADCVYFAKSKTTFTILDSRTLMLSGGTGPDIIIKVYVTLTSASKITVLKDDFCSHDTNVLYIDGRLESVGQVTKVN